MRSRRRRSVGDVNDVVEEKVTPKIDVKVEEAFEKVTEKIFDEIDELREDIDLLRHPRGTKESPARSCRDIKLGFPEAEDGTHKRLLWGFGSVFLLCRVVLGGS